MYVRTKKGEIFDCYESEQMHEPIYYPKKSKSNGYIDYEDVYKKSDNLIDILQVGDYVNGYIVKDILDNGPNGLVVQTAIDFLYERDIKSIVTKEMFEQMEYKIE